MLQKLPDLLSRRPCRSLFVFLLVLLGPFMFAPSNLNPWFFGDMSVYINMAQSMYSGGVLYKDAIDTKNMGFFFLFYGLYALYAKFFATMAYFFIFQAVFLFLWYWLFACLFYKTLCMVYSPLWSWLSSASVFAVFFLFDFMYFISQPQIALMIHLLYSYFVLKLKDNRGYGKYMLFGVLLGLAFAVASPYIFLTLTIPALIWIESKGIPPFGAFVLRSGAAFGGFLLALLPLFLYFTLNNALSDWWYWNYEFAQKIYTPGFIKGLGSSLFNMFFGSTLRLSLDSFNTLFYGVFLILAFILWARAAYLKIVKKESLSFGEAQKILLITVFPSILVRLSLSRSYFWYHLYLIPFLFSFFPLYWKSFPFSSKKICILLAPFYMGGLLNLWFAPKRPAYPDAVKRFIMENTNKDASYISVGFPSVYSYDLRWRNLYYNMYDFHAPELMYRQIVSRQPDYIFLSTGSSFTFHPNKEMVSYIESHYKPVFKIPSNDTGIIECFVRKDKFPQWNSGTGE